MPKLPDSLTQAVWSVIRSSEPSFEGLARVAGLRPERDFRYVVLRKVDFAGSDLSRFDFTGTHFERCNFAGARVGSATFTDAKFEGPRPEEGLDKPYGRHGVYDESVPIDDDYRESPFLQANEPRDLEEYVRQLDDEFGSPDWPLIFRRAWLTHGPHERLITMARQWLKSASFASAVQVLLIIMRDLVRKPESYGWFDAHALHLVHATASTEQGWVRLWRDLLHAAGHRDELAALGADRLVTLTQDGHSSLPVRKLERLWTDIWAELLRSNLDRAHLEELAQGASQVFPSHEFALAVLTELSHSARGLWAIDRLETWLFEHSSPDRGGFEVMSVLLELNPSRNVVTLGLNWLVAADPRVFGWARVWQRLMKHAAGEYIISRGIKWLLEVPVETSGWADVLAGILTQGQLTAAALELRQRAMEWLKLGRSHRERGAISEFARLAPGSSVVDEEDGTTGRRAKIVVAIERQFGVELIQIARNRFVSGDDSIRAVVRISKKYPRSGGARYWYSYYASVDSFLMPEGSFLVLGCMDRGVAYAIPADFLRQYLSKLHQTHGNRSSYWHLDLVEMDGIMAIMIPTLGPIEVGQFEVTI